MYYKYIHVNYYTFTTVFKVAKLENYRESWRYVIKMTTAAL
jgi:hypothetical protein